MIDPFVMHRRDMIARMALLLGATALPAEAFAAPGKAARYLPKKQFALLSSAVDTILPTTDTPGAVAAGVPARIDGMLRDWASPASREAILAALARIDAAAMAAKGKPLAKLSAADRAALLTPHDVAALKPVPPPPGAPPSNPFSQQTYVADQGYLKLKELTINLYYYSETGVANELEYLHVPGTWQPSLTLTAQSRPFLGIGPF